MKGLIKCGIGVVIGAILMAYVGYQWGLYPAEEFRDKAISEVKDEVSEFIEKNKDNNPGLYKGTENAYEQLKGYFMGDEDYPYDNQAELEHWYVTKVVDGDTIYAKKDKDSESIKIRYIGVDTPESVHEDETKNTKEGKIASDRNADILEENGRDVYLEFDVQREDKYGRTLAYVYIETDDGEYKMVQDILLEEGMCRTMTVQPNSKYADHFYELQVKAREAGEGFWGTEFYTEE